MEQAHRKDVWASGAAYEPYVGRWSRLVAREFLTWLAVPSKSRWLDIGCGTGALSQAILEMASPSELMGMDPSDGYLAYARQQIRDARARFAIGNASALPWETASQDAVVSGLVLNFMPHAGVAVAEMARVTRPKGIVAAYVWDYAGQMQLMRYFWDAAVALDSQACDLDEGRRFPLCQPGSLATLFEGGGLKYVEAHALVIPTHFRDFDDYWSPFLGGQGPAPGYTMSLTEERRTALRERLRAALPIGEDGSIDLVARAWAVRGRPS